MCPQISLTPTSSVSSGLCSVRSRPYHDMMPIDPKLHANRLRANREILQNTAQYTPLHTWYAATREGDRNSSSNTIASAHRATAAQLTASNDTSSCHSPVCDSLTSYTRYPVSTQSTRLTRKQSRVKVCHACPRRCSSDRGV